MADLWTCGAHGCRAIIRGGTAEKTQHAREDHPDLFGVIFNKARPEEVATTRPVPQQRQGDEVVVKGPWL